MTINFDALQASLGKIGKLGQGERTFKAGDSAITVRVLQAREEIEVDKYAQVAWEEAVNDEDRSALADYIDRTRVGTLSHVIVQIDDQDLRNVEYIETGEEDNNGNRIKKPRYQVIRSLIHKWSRSVLHVCYANYAALVTEVEMASSKAIESSEADIETEVKRLQARIDSLKSLGEQQKAMDHRADFETEKREAVNDYSQRREDDIQGLAQAVLEKQSEPEEDSVQPEPAEPAQSRRREPTIPRKAAPPVRPTQSNPPAPQPTDALGIPLPHEGDSIYDPTDGDAAVAAEHRRLEIFRRQMQTGQPPTSTSEESEEPEVLSGPEDAERRGRKPPHRDALNTADAVLNLQGETVREQPKAAPDVVEGVRMPVETISERNRPEGRPKKVTVDRTPAQSRNPRFKGAEK